jgi:hypothetical protein
VLSHNELIRQGYAYVGVSAQAVGANQLKTADPVRYASINFPGDSYSYDIYSQAGQAVSQDYRTVLAGLRPRTVLGVGESQSAARLVTYLDAVQPIANVYDGLLVHSRSAAGSALSQAPQAAIAAPAVTTIRNDLRVPVLVFETETDIFNSNLGERQPDTARFRLWEVAGTSHYDEYGLSIGPGDTGNGDGAVQALAAMQHPTNVPTPGIACDLPVNTGPAHWVLNDAVYALNAWVRRHVLPPTAPRITVVNTSPVVFATDANGNSIGGIRTPQVDAPVAILSGLPNTGAGAAGAFCRLFGSTVPYGTVQLATLYPSHASFVADWAHAAARDVRQGFLLPADAAELVDAAAASGIGG